PPPPSIDLQEGHAFVMPQQSFPTQHMYELTCRAHEYVHQEASGGPLVEAYEKVKSHMATFEYETLPVLLSSLQVEQSASPDDDFYSQVTYLLKRGTTIMSEGYELMDQFIASGDVDTLRAALA